MCKRKCWRQTIWKIGWGKKIKEKRGTVIAIGGCMMQEKHIVDKLQKVIHFWYSIWNTYITQISTRFIQCNFKQKRIEDIIDIDGEIIEGLPIKRNDNIKASVTIMYGCNNFAVTVLYHMLEVEKEVENRKI